jgi:hypothetical protein
MAVRRFARNLVRPLVCLLVTAQLLLAVPVAASAQAPGSSHGEMPCDQAPTPAGDDSCPCCPDGADSMKDCLGSCTLAAAIAPSIPLVQDVKLASEAFGDSIYSVANLSDPPLKPPPIA